MLLMYLLAGPGWPEGPMLAVAGLALWMCIWWISEAVPLPVTAMLPFVAFPLMGVMKAPIEKFVRTLAEPHAKLVRTVAAVRDAKQAA